MSHLWGPKWRLAGTGRGRAGAAFFLGGAVLVGVAALDVVVCDAGLTLKT